MRNFSTWFNIFPLGVFLRVCILQIARRFTFRHSFVSFAQSGEDYILHNFFINKENGFFIDVGCNDPIQISNSFYFYSKGWNGVNIDINPIKIDSFRHIRPDDISIVAAISDKAELKTYYQFSSDAVNTIDESKIQGYQKYWNLEGQRQVQTQTLTEILDKHIKTEQEIDFLSIDVEGMDFLVLKSLDLVKYKPKLIVIEIHDFNMMSASENEIVSYLCNYNYTLKGYISMNAYFIRNN